MPSGQFLTSANSTAHTGEFNLERFWHLESVGVNPADISSEDNVLNNYLASSVTRDQRT